MADRAQPPLRVSIVGMHYAPEHSGNAPYTTELARHLARAGHAVTALVGYPHYPEWQVHDGYRVRRPVEDDHGVRVRRYRHPVPARPSTVTRLLMESVFAVKAGVGLWRSRPQAVVAVSPVLLSLIPAVLLRRLRGFALGIWVQDIYGAALAETGLGSSRLTAAVAGLERWLLRRADAVVVIHEVHRRRLVGIGVAPEKIHIVPNWTHITPPVDVDRPAVRAALGWSPEEVIVLHAGNMGVKQGLEGLVELGRAIAERPADARPVRVVLMGDGSQREHLTALAADVPAVELVRPLPAGDFEAALAAADVLVLHQKPDVVEMSVPSKLTSYLVAGRPVVAATHPCSGAAELVAAAGAGVSVPAGEPGLLLAEIEALAADPLHAELLGKSGLAYALDHLGAGPAVRAHEAWILGLVDGRSSAPVPRVAAAW